MEDAIEAVITAVMDRTGASAKDCTNAARFGRNMFREDQKTRIANGRRDGGLG